jgi:type VI secretion system secreted protein VgrG
MVKYQSNKLHFEIEFSEVDETVYVYSYEAEEEISGMYEYRIHLLSTNPDLDPTDILNKKATFILNRGDDEPSKIHGIISQFEQRGKTPDYISYYAVLVPRMWRLLLNYQSVV